MVFDDNILKYEEKAVFALRKLYSSNGYRQFKMSKFEEYDLYSKNKDFLVSDGVITFNDVGGKLLALKPDVTLSIIKNSSPENTNVERYYYNENVYRIAEGSDTYKEIMQTGIECIGNITAEDMSQVLNLAAQSLATISDNFILNISSVSLLNALLAEYDIPLTEATLSAINDKNFSGLDLNLNEKQLKVINTLITSYEDYSSALSDIAEIANTEKSKDALDELTQICSTLKNNGFWKNIKIDFSIISNQGYYSGIVFKGFINGIPKRILSGGRYDKLMRRMNRNGSAVGFAVYLDTLERIEDTPEDDGYINIALPKGRLGEKVYGMFEKAGFECPAIKENNRKLIFENSDKKIRYFWVKPSDVAIYVARGAADIGVAGKDILLEYSPDVYELLDLNIGKCRMAVAAKNDFCDDTTKTLRVATKFSNIAKKYYAEKCRDIDIIHLNGSIEIAPILNLSDVIVDIVETGKTLLENNLSPRETIVDISARLISNKASYSFKTQKIDLIKAELQKQVQAND